jgi:pimeloyl-ACP methyl ester carboxylesterase
MPDHHRVPVADDEAVAAVHHPADGEAWLLFCHGFQSDKAGSYEERCERAVTEGYDAVRFDFRGCGEADGTFRDQDLSDKLADLRAVVERFGPDRYALFGSSFGGKVALHHAAATDRVWAVAARAPVTMNEAFEEYRRTVEREGHVQLDGGRAIDAGFFETFADHPFEAVVEGLDCPVAVVHGADDAAVPVEHTFRAARRLRTDVLVEKVAGEGHRFSRSAEAALRDRVFDWLATLR